MIIIGFILKRALFMPLAILVENVILNLQVSNYFLTIQKVRSRSPSLYHPLLVSPSERVVCIPEPMVSYWNLPNGSDSKAFCLFFLSSSQSLKSRD